MKRAGRGAFVLTALLCLLTLLFLGTGCRTPLDPSDPISILDHTVRLVERDFVFPDRLDVRWRTRVENARHTLGTTVPVEDQATIRVIDALIRTLGASHTRFLGRDEFLTWGLRNVFAHEIDAFSRPSIGIWPIVTEVGIVARDVVDGSPAARAGIRPGETITAIDGAPPDPVRSFVRTGTATLCIENEAGEQPRTVEVEVIERSLQRHHLEGMRESSRIIERDGVRIATVHLWSGTHESFRAELTRAAARARDEADVFLLDLRGGFGGAHPGYLDPFFDRTDPETGITTPALYRGPIVALIDGGTRSGKEWLAHDLFETDRATLVGTTTAGAFLGGRWQELVPERFYLFLAVIEGPRDLNLEGRGQPPHIEVRNDSTKPGEDAVWERGLEEALRMATEPRSLRPRPRIQRERSDSGGESPAGAKRQRRPQVRLRATPPPFDEDRGGVGGKAQVEWRPEATPHGD